MDKDDYRIGLVEQHLEGGVSSAIIETIAKNIDPTKYHEKDIDQRELGKNIEEIIQREHIDFESTILNIKYHRKPNPYFPAQLKKQEE